MADFNFFLNTQGLRGRTGAKGDNGFAPVIAIGQNTLNTFTLLITTADGTFETPNLRGSIVNNAGGGTFLRYDAETDSIYLSELPTASETAVGGVTIATDEELSNAAGTGVVTADNMGVGIYGALKAGNNVSLSLDNETGLVTISAEGGTQGTSNYEELSNKPSLYGKEIVGDKKLSDFIELKSPLNESIAVDYEKDVVIVNGNKTDDSLTLNTSWAPMFTDTSSASLPFDIDGDVTLNGNEFTPLSGVEMPYKVGDIIGVPGGTGADIALGNIREDGQFIFTHLLRVDGLGVSYINRAFMPVATKTNSSGTLKCTCDSTVTNELTTGQNFTDNCAYFQVRVEDGKMVAVFLKSVNGVFSNGVKVTSSNATTIANTEKLQRFSFGGVGSNVNLLSQFKLYRQPGLKLEECANQSAFAGLTNMVNWRFPNDETSLSINIDDSKLKIEGDKLTLQNTVITEENLFDNFESGTNIILDKTTEGKVRVSASVDNVAFPSPRIGLKEVMVENKPFNGFTKDADTLTNTRDAQVNMFDNNTRFQQSIYGVTGVANVKNGAFTSPFYVDIPIKQGSAVTMPYGFNEDWNSKVGLIMFGKNMGEGYLKPILLMGVETSNSNHICLHNFTNMQYGIVSSTSDFISCTGDTLTPSGDSTSYGGSSSKLPSIINLIEWNSGVIRSSYWYNNNSQARMYSLSISTSDVANCADIDTIRVIHAGGAYNNDLTQLRLLARESLINDAGTLGNLYAAGQQIALGVSSQKFLDVTLDNATVTTDSNGNLSVADDVLLKEQLYSQLVAGSNITLTEDADTHKVTIASTGGGSGGGASIDDTTTSSTSVWSSEKVNSELTSRDTTITGLQGEVVAAQGDIAALDGDVSTLNNVVGDHTTSITAINDSIAQLMRRIAALEAEINGGNA